MNAGLGIDFGSRDVKIVRTGGEEPRFITHAASGFYRRFVRRDGDAVRLDFEALGLDEVPGNRIAATGYGKNRVGVQGAVVLSEMVAHALGTAGQTGLTDFLNLDVGGQDFKAVLVRDGLPADMQTNPRCAASSGRFLENMARILEISLEELGTCWENPVHLSSTCSVFAESELIGLLSEGVETGRLAAGVNLSLVEKTVPSVQPMLEPGLPVVMTGGCACSPALVHLFGECLGREIIVPSRPAYAGALGCLAFLERPR